MSQLEGEEGVKDALKILLMALTAGLEVMGGILVSSGNRMTETAGARLMMIGVVLALVSIMVWR